MARSQDTIITNQGDTLDCKITRLSDSYIHFSVFDSSGVLLVRSRIPLSQVKEYNKTKDFKNENLPELEDKERIIADEINSPLFRVALQGGFTYQFGGYEGLPSSYQRQVQTLWNLGGAVNYFVFERFGIGAKYNHAFTKATDDFDSRIYGISSIRDEHIRFTYTALSLIYRNFLYDDQVVQYSVAGGIINYREDGLIDGNDYYEEGETFGVALGVSYDFMLMKNFGVGVGAEVNIAKLKEINSNGVTYPSDFSLTRIDIFLGIQWSK